MASLVDVSRLFRQVRQLKIRQRNVTQHRKDQIHIAKELEVEIVILAISLLMSMKAGGIEKEIERRRPMVAVVNIEIEEEDLGKLRRFQSLSLFSLFLF